MVGGDPLSEDGYHLQRSSGKIDTAMNTCLPRRKNIPVAE